MESAIFSVFIAGYVRIAFEHKINVSKPASVHPTGVLCWTLFILSQPGHELLSSELYSQTKAGIAAEMGTSVFSSVFGTLP